MELLGKLMKDPGITGEIASQRYWDARTQHFYLNPRAEGGEINIVSVSGEGLSLISGLLTISPDGKVNLMDEEIFSPTRPSSQ